MKKFIMPLLLACWTVTIWAANPAVDVISEGSTKILNIIKKDNGKNTAQVRQQMEAAAIPYFDFQRMTALAVGRGWRTATPAQQSALVKAFQTLLVRTYSSTMMRYKNADIIVSPNPTMANGGKEATVNSTIQPGDGKKPVLVDYTLYNGSKGWKIFNVSVEGASLVTAYRNQFNDEITNNGVDGLIKLLEAKNNGTAKQ